MILMVHESGNVDLQREEFKSVEHCSPALERLVGHAGVITTFQVLKIIIPHKHNCAYGNIDICSDYNASVIYHLCHSNVFTLEVKKMFFFNNHNSFIHPSS